METRGRSAAPRIRVHSYCFRPVVLGMPSSSRYLATVRRESSQPSRAIRSHSFWSYSGLCLSSPPISFFSRALAKSGEEAFSSVPGRAAGAPRLREKK